MKTYTASTALAQSTTIAQLVAGQVTMVTFAITPAQPIAIDLHVNKLVVYVPEGAKMDTMENAVT